MRDLRSATPILLVLVCAAVPTALRAQAPGDTAVEADGVAFGLSVGRYMDSRFGNVAGITSISFRATELRWGGLAPELELALAPYFLSAGVLALGFGLGTTYALRASEVGLLLRAGFGPAVFLGFNDVGGILGAYAGAAVLYPIDSTYALRLDVVPRFYSDTSGLPGLVLEVSAGVTSLPHSEP